MVQDSAALPPQHVDLDHGADIGHPGDDYYIPCNKHHHQCGDFLPQVC